ncbi:hypothetical protein [Flavobacterium sp.]|uniref:hypothetical protein n=1 Tax=Flavobacterium sp. TaxID=239 RepID=UPI002606E922|nr:hypothetical protein [Flavobacterium sp.]
MVTINSTEDQFIFEIKGWHQIWSFENKIKIEKENIVKVSQSDEEFTFWKGWRMPGTSLPWVITAGTYLKKGKRNFWDVTNKEKTIVVELKNSRFDKLIIEVENPLEAITLLNSK